MMKNSLAAVVEAVSDQTFELLVDTKGAIDEPMTLILMKKATG